MVNFIASALSYPAIDLPQPVADEKPQLAPRAHHIPDETRNNRRFFPDLSKFRQQLTRKRRETTSGAVKMYLRGIVLMGFSAACLGAASLAYQEDKRRSLSASISNTVGAAYARCQEEGIDTPFGRLGCIQTTSGTFSRPSSKGIRDNRGGAMFVKH